MADTKDTKAVSTTAQQLQVQPSVEEKIVSDVKADVTLSFLEEHENYVSPLTPQKERKLLHKLYFRLVTLLIVTNLMLYVSA